MKQDIILAGVGGQGILSIATVIGSAALEQGLYIKQAEVHGMSQRGGDVQSHLRLSTSPIHSDLIPHGSADFIISLEPMEALRYLPFLSEDGWIITNTVPVRNIPNYPPIEDVLEELGKLPRLIALDVDAAARETGSARSANMVLLGASAGVMSILEPDKLRDGIVRIFSRKGDAVVAANIKAFDAGLQFSLKNK
ncbi:MAG: indolepyruvate oxidoreductase subunit beta [Bacteroidales bacterium]|nr:indolepyruvate oxidoreductase subunit beta [Bacteroidales bacterium]